MEKIWSKKNRWIEIEVLYDHPEVSITSTFKGHTDRVNMDFDDFMYMCRAGAERFKYGPGYVLTEEDFE